MSRVARLFVYGTLQPQAGTRMARWIAARLVSAEAASVPGRLFAIRGGNGWFPALLPARPGARVRGTLCELRMGPGDLARLDRYEGREYRRIGVRVRTRSAGLARAQTYAWRIALPPGAPAIAGGDFADWLMQSRCRAFSTLRNGA